MTKLEAAYLAKRWGELFSPQSSRERQKGEIARRVKRVLQAAGQESPPVNLDGLAGYLNVSSIREIPLASKGRLQVKAGKVVIEVDSELDSDFLKRQVIAHELAHLILDDTLSTTYFNRGARSFQSSREYAQMEEMCDLGADEILLPAKWLDERLHKTVPSLDIFLSIARETACDHSYLARRILDAGYWPSSLFLWWKELDGKFFVQDAIPEEDDYSLSCYEPVASSSFLDVVLQQDSILFGSLQISNAFVNTEYPAQALALSDDLVLTLTSGDPRLKAHPTDD